MNFRKIDDLTEQTAIYKNTNVQIQVPDNIEFVHWFSDKGIPDNEVISAILSSLQMTLVLAVQYYYSRILKTQSAHTMSMFFTEEQFDRIKSIIYLLFSNKSAYRCYDLEHRELLNVQVSGIADYACGLIKKMSEQGSFPKEIERLYLKGGIISDIREKCLIEITDVCCRDDIQLSEFFRKICDDRFIRGIDVSAISLDDIENFGIIQYLQSKGKKIYLEVSEYGFAESEYTKYVFWS